MALTRASKSPVLRAVEMSVGTELVAEVRARALVLRPLRSRDPSAAVCVSWATIYHDALMRRVVDVTSKRRRR